MQIHVSSAAFVVATWRSCDEDDLGATEDEFVGVVVRDVVGEKFVQPRCRSRRRSCESVDMLPMITWNAPMEFVMPFAVS